LGAVAPACMVSDAGAAWALRPTPHAAATPIITAIQTALRMVIPLMSFFYL
jgi:hypothetical protein